MICRSNPRRDRTIESWQKEWETMSKGGRYAEAKPVRIAIEDAQAIADRVKEQTEAVLVEKIRAIVREEIRAALADLAPNGKRERYIKERHIKPPPSPVDEANFIVSNRRLYDSRLRLTSTDGLKMALGMLRGMPDGDRTRNHIRAVSAELLVRNGDH